VAIGLLSLPSFLAAHNTAASLPAAHGQPGAQGDESIDLVRLVSLCAERLQLNVRFEAAQLTGAVAVRLTEGLSDRDLWTMTNRALASRGFTTIQMPGEETITVVRMDEAGTLARIEEPDLSKARAGYVKVLHELTYASPADVLPTVKQVMSGSGGLGLALGRTNSILLADLRPNLEQVLHLLEFLDAAPREGLPVRVFSIRNRNSVELANLLNRLVGTGFLCLGDPRTGDRQDLGFPTPATGAMPAAPLAPIQMPLPAVPLHADRSRLVVSADETTNTLFAVGDANLIDKLEGIIKTLDVMESQVMLEVLIVNLSDSDAVDLGVEIRGLKNDSTILSLSSLFGLGAPNPTAPLVPSSLSGLTGVVLDPGDFSVLVNALQVLNKGRALNIPKVLVNSNQKAEIRSVLQTPFLSTNATAVIATTSFGGTQDAGTTINVRPQISEGDHLTLEYTVVLSTFVGPASDPSLPPPRQQNNLQSVATIPDGYTVALGGLETTSETEAVNRVPLLGTLPLIGPLFSTESTRTSHSRFYVFIRASILRSSDFQHLKFLSDVEMHRADVNPGWPVIEPALIR
jgi:type II secretory pathway component GspD/PulD (secretin)